MLVWRFLKEARGDAYSERAEQHATRAVGVTRVVAGLYIAAQALRSLLMGVAAGTATVGVGIAILSACLLPPLAYGKIRLAAQMRGSALRGDGILTAVGAILAVVTLLGLLVTRLAGWWWADPLVALLMTGMLLREGWRAFPQSRTAVQKNARD